MIVRPRQLSNGIVRVAVTVCVRPARSINVIPPGWSGLDVTPESIAAPGWSRSAPTLCTRAHPAWVAVPDAWMAYVTWTTASVLGVPDHTQPAVPASSVRFWPDVMPRVLAALGRLRTGGWGPAAVLALELRPLCGLIRSAAPELLAGLPYHWPDLAPEIGTFAGLVVLPAGRSAL